MTASNPYGGINAPYVPTAPGLVTQNIKQQITVNAGTAREVRVTIPQKATAFLRGYGYTWAPSCTFQLYAGFFPYPARTDQEGSIAQPMLFDTPVKLSASNSAALVITNTGTQNVTFEVVFILYTDTVINQASTGTEVIVATSGASAVTPTHSAVSVGVASTSVLAANGNRKGALIINDSDSIVYLNIAGGTAVLNTGIRLNAAGGSYEMSSSLGNLSTLAITGISSAASKNVIVTEFT